jgi:hypothetical protein
MGVRDQSRRPLGRSTSPPHCPTDPWARAHTDRPTCRFRGLCLNHATRQHACRAPCGNSGLRGLSRCWVCRRGIREMALGTESADPRGSCHQPRRYHVSPATHGSAGPLPRKTRHAVTQRASASLCTKCTRFDIIAVLYTCTTVASRVATNACATHLRFLTKPQTSSGLASRRSPGVVKT